MGRTVGSGQGSIYKRGDKWRGQISINGQRYSHTAKQPEPLKIPEVTGFQGIRAVSSIFTLGNFGLYFSTFFSISAPELHPRQHNRMYFKI